MGPLEQFLTRAEITRFDVAFLPVLSWNAISLYLQKNAFFAEDGQRKQSLWDARSMTSALLDYGAGQSSEIDRPRREHWQEPAK